MINGYTPAVPRPSSCEPYKFQNGPTIESSMKLYATNLPVKPSQQLCSCMMQSLQCVANPSVSIESLTATRSKLCKQNRDLCGGAETDPENGRHGSYALCNMTEKASWVINKFYLSLNGDKSSCTSSGGLLREGQVNGTSVDCKNYLDQAGPEGTGIVTYRTKEAQMNVTDGHSIGTGAKAGIAIGVIGALALAIVLVLWRLIMKKRKKQKLEGLIEVPDEPPATDTSEESNAGNGSNSAGQEQEHESGGEDQRHQLDDGYERHELDGKEKRIELDNNSLPVELPPNPVAELPANHVPKLKQFPATTSPSRFKEIQRWSEIK
jgi:X8 domain